MFSDNKDLLKNLAGLDPDLEMTFTLNDYRNMFKNCTSLTDCPKLPKIQTPLWWKDPKKHVTFLNDDNNT